MTTLVIGIAIGLAGGIILMMLSIPRRDVTREKDLKDTDSLDDAMEEHAGFIDIDYGKMAVSDQLEDGDSVYGLKRKLARFKLRNRFYN